MDVHTHTVTPTLTSPTRPALAADRSAAEARPLADLMLGFADLHRRKLLVLMLALYLIGFNGQWRLEPDSALYLSVGRNLAEGHGYTYHGFAHRLAFPGPPLLFAATFKLFHTRSLVPALIVMALMGLATLGLTYRLFLLHAGRPTAVLITFGLAISRLFYRYSFELLSDMPFLLGVMAFLTGFEGVFYRRRTPAAPDDNQTPAGEGAAWWFDVCLMAVGLAIAVVMRPTMWALLLSILAALGWSAVRGPTRGRRGQWGLVAAVIVTLAIVVLWRLDLFHDRSHIGQYEDAVLEIRFAHLGPMFHQMFAEFIPRLFEATLCQAMFGCPLGPVLNTLAGIAVLVFGLALTFRRPLWGIWIALTVAMMLTVIKPLDRYFLEVLPLLVYAWWCGIRWINKRLPRPWGDWAFLLLFLLGGITNLCRVGEFVVEQRWRPFLVHYKEGRFASTDQVVKVIQRDVAANDWVIAEQKFGRILTFLSRRNVTGPTPETWLNPAAQTVYVLKGPPVERLKGQDDVAASSLKQWLAETPAHLGPAVGPRIQGPYDSEPWQLYRALPGLQ